MQIRNFNYTMYLYHTSERKLEEKINPLQRMRKCFYSHFIIYSILKKSQNQFVQIG